MPFPPPPPPPVVPAGAVTPPQRRRPAPPERLPPRGLPAVEAFLAAGGDPAQRAHRTGTPLVDELDDGTCAVTFVVPDVPGCAGVQVFPNKVADPAHPAATAAERIGEVWLLTLRMPRDWRASYRVATLPAPGPSGPAAERVARALAVAPAADRAAVRAFLTAQSAARPDPAAREHLPDGTSVVALPGAPPVPRRRDPGERAGTVLHGRTGRTGRSGRSDGDDDGGHALWLHDPPGTGPGDPLPTVLLLDGRRWLDDGLPAVLDAAVADGRLPPLRTVGVDTGTGDARTRLLGCDPGFVALLRDRVLGWAGRHRALSPDPGGTVVAGQSLGGLTALYATRVAPERFGLALSQSGSFWWPHTGGVDEWLTAVLPGGPPTHGVHLAVGTEEWVLGGPTRRVRDALAARGDRVVLAEYRGGHDPACWRAGLVPALAGLLAGAGHPPG